MNQFSRENSALGMAQIQKQQEKIPEPAGCPLVTAACHAVNMHHCIVFLTIYLTGQQNLYVGT